jgi:putative transcriptional regulator
VPSGSPVVFVLRLARNRAVPKTVDGAIALARRGIPMLRAKRAMEELLASGSAFVALPTVESPSILAAELAEAGIAAAPLRLPQTLDVRRLRQRLGLTREQFAARYGLDVETLRNWEVGRREPDRTARSYLQAISNDPEGVEQAYAPTPALTAGRVAE